MVCTSPFQKRRTTFRARSKRQGLRKTRCSVAMEMNAVTEREEHVVTLARLRACEGPLRTLHR